MVQPAAAANASVTRQRNAASRCQALHQRGAKKLFFHPRDTSEMASVFNGGGEGALDNSPSGLPRGLDLHLPNGNLSDQKRRSSQRQICSCGFSHLYNNPAGRDDEVTPERSAASQSLPGPGSMRLRGKSIQKKRPGKLRPVRRVLGEQKLSICVDLFRVC